MAFNFVPLFEVRLHLISLLRFSGTGLACLTCMLFLRFSFCASRNDRAEAGKDVPGGCEQLARLENSSVGKQIRRMRSEMRRFESSACFSERPKSLDPPMSIFYPSSPSPFYARVSPFCTVFGFHLGKLWPTISLTSETRSPSRLSAPLADNLSWSRETESSVTRRLNRYQANLRWFR